MIASLVHKFESSEKLWAQIEGSATPLQPDMLIAGSKSDMFIGWGLQPYFFEFDSDGIVVLDVQFTVNTSTVQSYRSFREKLVGFPGTRPDLVFDAEEREESFFLEWGDRG